jgi:hypothetical protein
MARNLKPFPLDRSPCQIFVSWAFFLYPAFCLSICSYELFNFSALYLSIIGYISIMIFSYPPFRADTTHRDGLRFFFVCLCPSVPVYVITQARYK